MADGKELKPKSFRIDDKTADKFKEISAAIGGNQQETLSKLIEAWEFQSGKTILMDKKADIEQFEKYITALTRMYMGSLEDNQNITEIVRTEFDALLRSKDATIQELQSQLTVVKQLKEESTTKARAYADENSRLNECINSLQKEFNSKLDDMQSMLTDKESLNRALTDSCNGLKAKVDSMAMDHEQLTSVRKDLADMTVERDALKQGKAEAEKSLAKSNKEHERIVAELKQHETEAVEHCKEQMKVALDKAVLETERKYQEQIQTLKEQKQTEIDKYQQKYFDLLEQIKNNNTATFERKT